MEQTTASTAASPANNYASFQEYFEGIDYSCNSDSDCVIKDVGLCCGQYNRCMNSDAVTDLDFVSASCSNGDGINFGCQIQTNGCLCVNHVCNSRYNGSEAGAVGYGGGS